MKKTVNENRRCLSNFNCRAMRKKGIGYQAFRSNFRLPHREGSGNPVYLQDSPCPFDFPATNRLTVVRGDTLEVFFTRRRKELDIPELEDL